jgi:hypothetical protein
VTDVPEIPLAASAMSDSCGSMQGSSSSHSSQQADDPLEASLDRVDQIGLPVYSERVALALESGQIILELDKCIEETAYHIMRHGDMKSKSDYAAYGQKMYNKYPCINFNTKIGDTTPWVRKFVKSNNVWLTTVIS